MSIGKGGSGKTRRIREFCELCNPFWSSLTHRWSRRQEVYTAVACLSSSASALLFSQPTSCSTSNFLRSCMSHMNNGTLPPGIVPCVLQDIRIVLGRTVVAGVSLLQMRPVELRVFFFPVMDIFKFATAVRKYWCHWKLHHLKSILVADIADVRVKKYQWRILLTSANRHYYFLIPLADDSIAGPSLKIN